MLGRAVKTEKPGFGGTLRVAENFYNDKGQLYKTTQPGLAATLYEYDDLGNQVRSGLDIDGNGVLEPASPDRISDSDTLYAKLDGHWWQESSQQVYAVADDATATTAGTSRTRLTGLGDGGLSAENVAIDIHGNETISREYIDRASATVQRITDYPDSAIDAVTVSTRVEGDAGTNTTCFLSVFIYWKVKFSDGSAKRLIQTSRPN
jgi:hypothetical protein